MLTAYTTDDSAERIEAQENWNATKEISRGGHQAIEDKAIQNYHEYIAAGKSKEEASQMYFETITFFYDRSRSA